MLLNVGSGGGAAAVPAGAASGGGAAPDTSVEEEKKAEKEEEKEESDEDMGFGLFDWATVSVRASVSKATSDHVHPNTWSNDA